MRDTLLLIWWILTPVMVVLTLLGSRLGDETSGPPPWVGVLWVAGSVGWVSLTVGLVLTRRREQSPDS